MKKTRVNPFKRHLQQNWMAENMQVVAGRLVALRISLRDIVRESRAHSGKRFR